jgi:hypothetical protein
VIWTDYFNLIKVLPGRIVTPRYGTLDFADPNLPVEEFQASYKDVVSIIVQKQFSSVLR